MKKKQEIEYIFSTKQQSEKDLEFEKNNITLLNQPNLSFKYLSTQYATFKFPKVSLTKEEQSKPPYAECFVSQFDDTGSYLACGYSNGFVNIFALTSQPKIQLITFKVSDYPITSLKWNKKLKTTLIVVSADGSITHWHSSSGKILHTLHEKTKEGLSNAINSIDYSRDYRKFVTGGKDTTVRVYDEGMKTKICEMSQCKFDQPGHSSRIFCVKFNPDNVNTIISGGWDKTIQFYDVREGKIVNSIYGPQICGEALDISGNYILSGAWSTGNQIQIWDVRTLKCVSEVKWENDDIYFPTYIYSVKFNTLRDKKMFGVGGVNKPLYRVFECEDMNEPRPVVMPTEWYSECYSVDFVKMSNKKEMLVCGCGDGGARLFEIEIQ